MVFEEYLHLYADGALSDAGQTELFHIIAVSPEKRAMFNDFQTMRSAFVKDRVSTVVPAVLEDSVLYAASNALPGTIASVVKSTVTSVGVWKVIMPYMTSLSIVAAGALGFVAGKYSQNTPPQVPASAPIMAQQQSVPPLTAAVDSNANGNVAQAPDHASDAASHPSTSPVTADIEPLENPLSVRSTLPPARWAPQGFSDERRVFFDEETLDSTTLTVTNTSNVDVTIRNIVFTSAQRNADDPNFFAHDLCKNLTIPAGGSHTIATVGFTPQSRNQTMRDTLAVYFAHHSKPSLMIPVGGIKK